VDAFDGEARRGIPECWKAAKEGNKGHERNGEYDEGNIANGSHCSADESCEVDSCIIAGVGADDVDVDVDRKATSSVWNGDGTENVARLGLVRCTAAWLVA
jgi:hypothetical protein